MIPSSALISQLQDFVDQNNDADEKALLLKHKTILGFPASFVADQIAGRRKAKHKLPSWHVAKNVLYPPSINLEQSSSEITANYKLEIVKQAACPLNKAADLTGGFGVDGFLFASTFKEVDYVEPDQNLFELVRHNHKALGGLNIHHHNTSAETFLTGTKSRFDLIYIDPSRRSKGKQKIFRMADCLPDITLLQDAIFNKADLLLLKASPMVDLQQGAKELKHVTKIFVVAVDNECKEVLFLCRKDFKGEPRVRAINLKSSAPSNSSEAFDYLPSEEKSAVAVISRPLTYLYEPDAAILKAGAFKLVGNRYRLQKLHQHTHLYTSENLIQNFPGKVFKVDALIKPDPKVARLHFPEGKANVVTRNYPISPEQLKKKTGLKDGGDQFLIGFSGETEKYTAVCSRLS